MSATSISLREFKWACYADYIHMGAQHGVEWLEQDASECDEAARFYADPPLSEAPDPAAAQRAKIRGEAARAVAALGIQAIRRESSKYKRGGRK